MWATTHGVMGRMAYEPAAHSPGQATTVAVRESLERLISGPCAIARSANSFRCVSAKGVLPFFARPWPKGLRDACSIETLRPASTSAPKETGGFPKLFGAVPR